MKELIDLLLEAPDSQLDATMKPLIKEWSDPPKALEILKVLDTCVYGALASGFTITALRMLYDSAVKQEGTTHEEVAKSASWRNHENK